MEIDPKFAERRLGDFIQTSARHGLKRNPTTSGARKTPGIFAQFPEFRKIGGEFPSQLIAPENSPEIGRLNFGAPLLAPWPQPSAPRRR
jgi:hypothetical protein